MDKYEHVREIGAGNFGVTKLMRNKDTRELVAMKFIERGNMINENVAREIVNHHSLRHPNIVRFKEVVLTPTHLAIVMEYAAGGALSERMCETRFSEDEARYFFQQLVCGVSFCHAMNICHRDIKPENALLDGSPAPRLKICDFRYSKSSLLHSRPKSMVGSPAFIAPEVLSRREYDGEHADVWSCGVTLYVMLVAAYPFEDPKDPKNILKTISRIISGQYKIPEYVHISQDCRHLLSRIFVVTPYKRITMREIKSHPWYLKNLPRELTKAAQAAYYSYRGRVDVGVSAGLAAAAYSSQSLEEIGSIVQEAQTVLKPARPVSSHTAEDEDSDQYGDAKAGDEEKEEQVAEQAKMENIYMEFDSLESILGGRESPRNLKLPFLQFITKNFSDEQIIGIGGCGVVYKGILPNQIIAVKRLLNSHTIEDKMFHREVKSMIMVSHKNVVRFLGYCSHTEEHAVTMEGAVIIAERRERLLCFEYLINGNLENYLTDELRGLEWQTRYQIIRGICDGLHHLHREKHIVHMDLKPANILLDSNMVPKITDFGISRLDNVSQTTSSERLISLGYCAPEYQHHGKFSAKSDIYSMGVIILELVTGSKVEPDITKVHRRWKHRWNRTAKDAQLGYKQVSTCLHLAGRCMQMNPTDRPDIWDIINCLTEMDTTNGETGDGSESLELDDVLGVEPLEIHLPFKLNMQISCSVELTNDTDDHFAFRISNNSLRPYCIEAYEGAVSPRSKCSVTISLQALDTALPVRQCRDEFSIQSTRVDGSLAAMNIGSGDIFIEKPGKVIDTVDFSVVLSEVGSPSAHH